jgi:diguanylate cyclase (GGDEF)-like protein
MTALVTIYQTVYLQEMPLMSPSRTLSLRAILLAGALLGTPGGLQGSPVPEGRMAFRSFGPDQGLGTATVCALLPDRAGFMWVGTENGLYRYDGNRFKAYGLKDGLPSHFIWSLHQSPDGTLWVGTFKGLARMKDDHFETVALGPDGSAPEVSAIATGPQGRLWVATTGGLYSQGADGTCQPVPGWPGGAVTALWARPDQTKVWASAWSGSQARVLSWDNGSWSQFPVAGTSSKVDALAVDGGQRVWARSLKTLWQLNAQDGQFRPAAPGIPAATQRGHLFVDRAGRLWATTERGLVCFAKEGPKWITHEGGLPEVSLTSVAEDPQGTLWAAGAGVYHLQGGGAWRSYPAATGLPAGPVWSIFKDRDGQRFVGTDRGLYQNTPKGWSLVKGTSGMQVRTIVQAQDQSLYLAGSPEILRWEPRSGTVTRLGAADGVLTGGGIYRLLLTPDGTLWVATDKGGLLRGTLRGGRMAFQRVDVPQGVPNEIINDLCLDAAGRLWASGDHGLLVQDGATWRRFTTRDGLRNDHVTYLTADAQGQVTFAYFEPLGLALARFDRDGFHLLRHLDDTITPDKVIYLMGRDAKNQFWVGTGQGLDRVNPARQVEHFGREDGLVGEDTNSMAFLAEPDGDVWVGTSFGLARFNAAQDLGVPKPPNCMILSARLGGAPIQAQGLVRTSSRASTFEAEFVGLSFAKEGDFNFETRMIGLEPEWHPTSTREVRYPALPAGAYRFEVRSRIGSGEWSSVAGQAFEVLPTWSQSWWFRVLVGLGALGLGGLATWVRLAALQRRNQTLKNMVEEQTRELALANEQLKNQSLTDPLTGLKNRRFLGVCMPEDVAQVNRVHHSSQRQGIDRLALNIDMIFIMVDLDHFKDVNDRYGHAAGDLVLQEVAQILRQATRDSDTIVRWGGEEFLVVARNACRTDATILMNRILTQVAEHPFQLKDGRIIHCTCSLGFTFYPFVHRAPELLSWERLLDLADHCLYAAKRGGRNAWVGLFPGDEIDLQALESRIPSGLGELLWKHQLECRTSLAEDVILEWDGNA